MVVFATFVAVNVGSIAGSAVPPVPTYTYNHTISPSPPVAVSTLVTDTVTPNPASATFDGRFMLFQWQRPTNGLAHLAFVPKSNNQYESSFKVEQTGLWTIKSDEVGIGRPDGKSSVQFNVVPAPEFGKAGLAAVPLFLIGIFYMRLRKSILK